MITMEFTRNGQTGTKRVHDFAITATLASFRAAGYTITAPAEYADAPATEAAPAATEQTGTVGKGHEVHRIVAGHSVCGASYRRNSLGSSARQVNITGEPVTCRAC